MPHVVEEAPQEPCFDLCWLGLQPEIHVVEEMGYELSGNLERGQGVQQSRVPAARVHQVDQLQLGQ